MALSVALLREDHDVEAINYFTSRVLPYPPDQSAVNRQNLYLQVLSSRPKVRIVEGLYARRKTLLPFAAQPCKSCERVPSHMAKVFKFEEKRTDVALASAMIADSSKDRMDCVVLISGDSDFVPAVETVRREFGKTVLVFDPSDVHSEHLKIAASFYKNIPRDLPARCQLPESIPVGTHGRFIHRPAAWGEQEQECPCATS